jgi:putative chitinase
LKNITLFIIFFISTVAAFAQSNYEEALSQGDIAFKKGQYIIAMNKYYAAEAFDPAKKEVVKARVLKTFEKIEALRELAETEKKKAEKALKEKLKADSATKMAVVAQRLAQKEKEEIDKNFKLIKNTNKILAQKLYSLSDEADSATKQILIYVQNILAGNITLDENLVSRGLYYPITADDLKAIAGNNTALMPAIAEWLTKTCPKYGIDNKQIYAHFLAQASFETAGFTRLVEYGNGQFYEGRVSLGNVNPGDGAKYKGRGIFPVVGRNNYLQLGILRGDRDLFINNPELLEQPEYAVWAACELWKNKGLVEMADLPDTPVSSITKKINGGFNGLAKREEYFEKALAVLK